MKLGTTRDGSSLRLLAAKPAQSWGSALSAVAAYLPLFKLRIVALLLFIAGMTALISAGGFPPWRQLVWLLSAGALASAGASMLNHYLDRDVDARMERTRKRPLASGRVKQPGRVLLLGILLILLSLPLALRLNPYVALLTLSGALIYAGVYTWWLKRRSRWNVVIGGLAGSCVVLAGWVAVGPQLSPLAFIIAAIVFLWTPLHFWNFALVHRADYLRAGIPMLPAMVGEAGTVPHLALSAGGLFALSLLPYIWGYFGPGYLLVAVASGALLWGNLRLLTHPSPRLAWRNYKLSGIYLALLFLAMAGNALI